MQIGLIGLGKMGFNLALNLKKLEHEVFAFDVDNETRNKIGHYDITAVESIEQLVKRIQTVRVIWLMVPAGKIVDDIILALQQLLNEGDIIIDGGNSNYKDSIRRSVQLKESGIKFLDCGTSGGTEGALNGVCAMVGGAKDAFLYCEHLFRGISVKDGYLYCGEAGSGHYVKMIHNGIEYGMMQAIAEGFEVLQQSEFDLDLRAVAKVWNNGSVVRSWLMELTENALAKDPRLDSIKGVMHSSGEGKWTLETALEKQIATPVIALSVLMRYRSLIEDTFSGKLVAALRNEFGGHAVVKK